MITIRNTQRKIPIDIEKLHQNAQVILDSLRYHDYDLGIWLASDIRIRAYNRDYRNKDKVTDILSFPYHTELKAGERIVSRSPEDKNLGDLIIAPNYVYHDLARWNQSFEKRMQILLVHGICHLLGYDHIKDEDY
ncbi:rRNA maturation RNase YbeY, partial [Candidatus Dependentiae bacterium]|nr:rRNA maturation RNase YbeY [Candidatus Dependentiae bacterium]